MFSKLQRPVTTKKVMIVEELEVSVTPELVAPLLAHKCDGKSLDQIITERHGAKFLPENCDVVGVKMHVHSRTPKATTTRVQQALTLQKSFWREDTARVAYTVCFITFQHKVSKERVVVDVVNTQLSEFKRERGVLDLE